MNDELVNYIDFHFSGAVAKKYGIYQALVLNRIVWSIKSHIDSPNKWRDKYFIDGRWWMDDTHEAISNHFCGLIAQITVRKAIKQFENDGILIAKQFDIKRWIHTKWYSIDIVELNKLYVIPNIASSDTATDRYTISGKGDPQYRSREAQDIAPSSLRINLQSTKNLNMSSGTNQAANAPSDLAYGKSAIDDLNLNNSDLILDREQGSSLEKQEGHLKRSEDLSNTKTTPKKSKPLKTLVSHWETTDPFNGVFRNMTSLSICKARFDANDYRAFLTGLMESLSLSISELETLSEQWSEYHNERTVKPKVAKSSFRTWVNNYVERRSKNIQYNKSTTNPHRLPNQNEYNHDSSNPKYHVPIDALPF